MKIFCIDNVSRSGIQGTATFKEGHASMQVIKNISVNIKVSKNGENTIDKSNLTKVAI